MNHVQKQPSIIPSESDYSFLNQGFLEALSHMRIIPNISNVHNCQLNMLSALHLLLHQKVIIPSYDSIFQAISTWLLGRRDIGETLEESFPQRKPTKSSSCYLLLKPLRGVSFNNPLIWRSGHLRWMNEDLYLNHRKAGSDVLSTATNQLMILPSIIPCSCNAQVATSA